MHSDKCKQERAGLSVQMKTSETHAYHVDFALHTLGWKAFQDLCAQVMEEELKTTVSVYREAQDGGRMPCSLRGVLMASP